MVEFALGSTILVTVFTSAFQYQHDARFVPGGISLFDNGGVGAPPALPTNRHFPLRF
jgi:hypothetical protein